MNPLALIKRGLTTGDWGDISKAYNALTGEDVSGPKGTISANDLIRDINYVISQYCETTSYSDEEPKTEKKPKVSKKSKVVRQKENKIVEKNSAGDSVQFISDLDISSAEDAINAKVSKAMKKLKPRKRKIRPAPVETTFTCSECHKDWPTKDQASVSIDGEGSSRCFRCVRRNSRG